MSNPRYINTANVEQFGFTAVIDTENRKIIFDITGLTVFKAGGAANVQGIDFSVEDPAGVEIAKADFVNYLDPSDGSVFEVALPGSLPIFGWYKIKGVLKEADAAVHEIVLQSKEIFEPKGWNGKCVPGSFKETVDCYAPFLRLSETTLMTYIGKSPDKKTSSGKLYYPQGTINPVDFTRTPFQNNKVYTGDYRVRNKTVADYSIGDNVFVRIAYASDHAFDITCQSRICDVACCIEQVQQEAKQYAGTQRGHAAQEKLDKISTPLIVAVSQETCGKDASAQIKIIRDVLACDCGCDGAKPIEPAPVQLGAGAAIVVEGAVATSVTPETEGSTTTYTVKTKQVQVVKSEQNDTAFSISRTEDADSIVFLIGFNYSNLTQKILDTIKNSQDFTNILNSLIAAAGIDASVVGLDGKCIIDLSKNQYALSIQTDSELTRRIHSITIGGVEILAPNNLLVTNELGIQAWFNGLNRGNFNVSVVPVTGASLLTITSADNPYNIGTMKFMTGNEPMVVQVGKTNKTLKNILQAVIDYLCSLSASKLTLGTSGVKLCYIDANGNVRQTAYGGGYNLAKFIENLSELFCDLVSKVAGIVKINCETIRKAFPASNADIVVTDVVMGTRGGECAQMSIKDLAIAIHRVTKDTPSVLSAFCAIDCGAAPACPAVAGIIYSTSIE